MGRTPLHAIIFALLPLILAQAQVSARSDAGGAQVRPVNYSFARPDEAIVRHIDLNLTVDFAKKQLAGRASLEIDSKPGASRLVLDTRDLTIRRVTLGRGNAAAAYVLGETVAPLGRPLIIDITPETRVVNIDYATDPATEAIQWVAAARTAGKKTMLMYTHSEPILARSWIPCQDLPEVRASYKAIIKTPPGMLALMSAANATKKNPRGIYEMGMTSPIPSYLIALAVGDLDFRRIGRRTGVYAERSVVDRAAFEFADAEKMLAVAESLYGPYRWGRWDILVLPPCYPFGGMENPRLTFVTPAILAGDRSLVPLIVHELGHSWAGDLVTSANWSEEWLNEGMATYLERRIVQTLFGSNAADLEAQLGYRDLTRTIRKLGATNSDTRLYEDLKGRDPAEANRDVVYEKGYLFLRTIEEYVGRRRWESFLRTYFDRYAFQSMTTTGFLKYAHELLARKDSLFDQKLQIDAWVNGTGLPSNCPALQSALADQVDLQIRALRDGTPPNQLKTTGWRANQWIYFLGSLSDTIAEETAGQLEAKFKLSTSENSDIVGAWLEDAIRAGFKPLYPAVDQFLIRFGRLNYLDRLYTALCKSPEGLERAKSIYRKARSGYHPLAVKVVDAILQWKE